MIVANSSPVIILAKQGLLNLLQKCFENVLIPENVYNEVMHKNGSLEAIALEKAIKEKWISVQKVNVVSDLDTKSIGQGEKEAISLAIQNKSILLIDDDTARKYASIFDIEAHGTFYIIYLACAKKLIEKSAAKNIIDSMMADGFYVSSEIYSRFMSLMDTLE